MLFAVLLLGISWCIICNTNWCFSESISLGGCSRLIEQLPAMVEDCNMVMVNALLNDFKMKGLS